MGTRNGNGLDAVRARFDAWRRHKLSRRIPEDLWRDAIALVAEHSVTEVCEHLGLNSWRFSRKQAELEANSRARKEPKAGVRRAGAGASGKLSKRAKSHPPVPVIDPRFVEVTPMHPLDGLGTSTGARTGVRLVAEKSDGARLTVELPAVDAATLRELCVQFFAPAGSGKPGRRH
jgi:hypothetical protein